MADAKVIAVVGATGRQGGGLARALLEDPRGGFRLRALTRNPDAESARALKDAGAEVVRADLDDRASLARAFRGAHGAFCLTNAWEHFSPEKEMAQATAMAEAAREAGVSHAIWSTLEDTRRWVPLASDRMPTLQGRYKVPHFDAKGEADAAFARRGPPTTYLLTSFYWENLVFFGMGPQAAEDGTLALRLPMGGARLPGIAVEDIGRCAYSIFRGGERWHGKRVGLAGEHPTGSEMADALGAALGRRVRYEAIPFEVYRGLGFPGAEDLGNMFQFKHDFQEAFCGPRDPAVARALHPGLRDFRGWLRENAARIPVAG
jgi:uncharacterized protein YbjT (DUF2867 family)